MEKLTSYNYRKIINLIFLLTSIIALVVMTVIKNTSQGNIMMWEMIFSSSIDGKVKMGAIICGALFIIAILSFILTIPRVLKKHNNSYFGVQGLVSVLLVIMLIVGKITNALSIVSFVLVGLTLFINVVATIYSYNIAKYNYDEIYNYVEEAQELTEDDDNGNK